MDDGELVDRTTAYESWDRRAVGVLTRGDKGRGEDGNQFGVQLVMKSSII